MCVKKKILLPNLLHRTSLRVYPFLNNSHVEWSSELRKERSFSPSTPASARSRASGVPPVRSIWGISTRNALQSCWASWSRHWADIVFVCDATLGNVRSFVGLSKSSCVRVWHKNRVVYVLRVEYPYHLSNLRRRFVQVLWNAALAMLHMHAEYSFQAVVLRVWAYSAPEHLTGV